MLFDIFGRFRTRLWSVDSEPYQLRESHMNEMAHGQVRDQIWLDRINPDDFSSCPELLVVSNQLITFWKPGHAVIVDETSRPYDLYVDALTSDEIDDDH